MKIKRVICCFLLVSIILTGCTLGKKDKETEVVTDGHEVVATDLKIPWSTAFEGEAFFISERDGAIVKIEDDEVQRQKVFLNKPLSNAAEAGLLGFILHPIKEDTALAYYTYESGTGPLNRVVEMIWRGDGWYEGELLLDQIPSGSVHHGGRIKIGPDGLLYITTGDAANAQIAQDLNSLGGKILRMNLDGTVPDDNPFENSLAYSYGHRNPQGLAWDESGQLFSSERGQSAHDEINQIEPGANYGWPLIQGDETKEEMQNPLFHSGTTTWAPSGLAYKDGFLYAAQLRGQGILAFHLEAGTYSQIVNEYGRIRDVFIHENYLYFITNNTDGRGVPNPEDDKLIRIPLNQET